MPLLPDGFLICSCTRTEPISTVALKKELGIGIFVFCCMSGFIKRSRHRLMRTEGRWTTRFSVRLSARSSQPVYPPARHPNSRVFKKIDQFGKKQNRKQKTNQI